MPIPNFRIDLGNGVYLDSAGKLTTIGSNGAARFSLSEPLPISAAAVQQTLGSVQSVVPQMEKVGAGLLKLKDLDLLKDLGLTEDLANTLRQGRRRRRDPGCRHSFRKHRGGTDSCLVAASETAEADVLIAPAITVSRTSAKDEQECAIQAGYEAARAALPRIMAKAGRLQPVVVTKHESADAAGI